MMLLSHKPNAADAIARLRTLYARQAGDRIFARMHVPSPALAEFGRRHVSGYCEAPNLDERIAFWDRLLAEQAVLEDDSIPAAYLTEMDQGLYGALVDGEVRFQCDAETGWVSSMVVPILKDWSGFDALRIDPTHPWMARYTAQLDLFLARAAGRFGISHFILIDALNFVFELLGATETYLSAETHPDMLRRAIDFAFDLNVMVQDAFFARDVLVDGGTSSDKGVWIPGRVVSESIDPYHMTSVAFFEQWGREPVERILGRYDGGVLHVHANGRRLCEAAASVRGVQAIAMFNDRGLPRAIDVVDDLRTRTADVPLLVTADYPTFAEKLAHRALPGGIIYDVHDVPDADTANRLMEQIRAYRI
ncbi:MAG: hypothetical protein JW809_02720 [Pirellulales bacterium]|nr:hypothetical protein [Pirellulales bacterium]